MIATTTVSIYRGTTTDEFADVADNNTLAIATSVPASLIERSRKVFNPADNQIQTIRYVTGRVRPGVDVLSGDRLKDERTKLIYNVDSVHQVASVGYTADQVLDVRRL